MLCGFLAIHWQLRLLSDIALVSYLKYFQSRACPLQFVFTLKVFCNKSYEIAAIRSLPILHIQTLAYCQLKFCQGKSWRHDKKNNAKKFASQPASQPAPRAFGGTEASVRLGEWASLNSIKDYLATADRDGKNYLNMIMIIWYSHTRI